MTITKWEYRGWQALAVVVTLCCFAGIDKALQKPVQQVFGDKHHPHHPPHPRPYPHPDRPRLHESTYGPMTQQEAVLAEVAYRSQGYEAEAYEVSGAWFVRIWHWSRYESKIIVTEYYATWCGPCKSFAPTFDAWSKKYTQAEFRRVDIDKEKTDVRSVPTIVIRIDGKETKRFVGAPSEADFKKVLE